MSRSLPEEEEVEGPLSPDRERVFLRVLDLVRPGLRHTKTEGKAKRAERGQLESIGGEGGKG